MHTFDLARDETRSLHILDVGARFGVHPSFKPIQKIASFGFFESDLQECHRLALRYRDVNEVSCRIYNYAVGCKSRSSGETVSVNQYSNPAISGVFRRTNLETPTYQRLTSELIVKEVYEAPVCTLDDLLELDLPSPDFLKIDTEGFEVPILLGCDNILKSVLGVRIEVTFCKIHEGPVEYSPHAGTFPVIHDLMLANGFKLLNLDYAGRGDSYSTFCSGVRYGLLRSTDAVYIVDPHNLRFNQRRYDEALSKLALFCFLNCAPDVALYLLTTLVEKSGSRIKSTDGPVHQSLEVFAARHFYNLKWEPSISRDSCKAMFEDLFMSSYPEANRYNESAVYNPI